VGEPLGWWAGIVGWVGEPLGWWAGIVGRVGEPLGWWAGIVGLDFAKLDALDPMVGRLGQNQGGA
jgi:hypothetical protein